MNSIRIITGIIVCTIVITSVFNFETRKNIQVTANEGQLVIIEDAFINAQELEKKTEDLKQKTEQQLNSYQEFYNDHYDKEMKLVYNHITYSGRLVSRGENFLVNNTKLGGSKDNALNLDLRTRSAVTAHEINNYILKNTNMAGLGEAFIQSEIDYNINAFFLLTLAIHESNWGKSKIATHKNNLFGFGAYDASPYESAIRFSSKEQCIRTVAKYLSESYLKASGRHFSGGYTLMYVNKKYATDRGWGTKIARIMESLNLMVLNKQDTNYHQILYGEGR